MFQSRILGYRTQRVFNHTNCGNRQWPHAIVSKDDDGKAGSNDGSNKRHYLCIGHTYEYTTALQNFNDWTESKAGHYLIDLLPAGQKISTGTQ